MDERLAMIPEGFTASHRGGRASAGQLGLWEKVLWLGLEAISCCWW
jgi:hypothetical protein